MTRRHHLIGIGSIILSATIPALQTETAQAFALDREYNAEMIDLTAPLRKAGRVKSDNQPPAQSQEPRPTIADTDAKRYPPPLQPDLLRRIHEFPFFDTSGNPGLRKNGGRFLTDNGIRDAALLPRAGGQKEEMSSPALCGPSEQTVDGIRRLVATIAGLNNVDETLALAIAFVESGFDRQRNSSKGARGPMQLMPSTAARFGVNDVCNAVENITGGIKYLRVLQEQFKNPLLIAAAYNAGEARIIAYGGIPPFAETVNYVARVVNYQLGLKPPFFVVQPGSHTRAADETDGNRPNAGVIDIRKDGKFNGGVMHL
jgi:hypothetical protein